MIVMFLYISSLALREKIKIETKVSDFSIILLIPLCSPLRERPLSFLSLNELFAPRNSLIIMFFIIYLSMTLVICVKLAESFKGALIKRW